MNKDAILVAIMAAGRGTRFGGGKLDAYCAGKRVGQWTIDAVAQADLPPGVIVTGPVPPRFLSEASDWNRIVNPSPSDGLGASVATAARMAEQRGSEALMILLADMPLVTPAMLLELAAQTGSGAFDHGAGRAGVPALLPAHLFGKLTRSEGDTGAARLLAGLKDVKLLPIAPGLLRDVDTPDDLCEIEAQLLQRISGTPHKPA